MSFLSNEYFAGLGHSTPGWSEEERLKFPCPGRDGFVCLLPMAVMRCIMHARWLILLVLCPAGRHCEEGTYQDSWFLSNRRVYSKPCMQSSYISGVEHIRLCKSRPTPVRSTIHIKPSHLSACMLVTIVSKPVRGTIVRWLASLSEGWINVISLCCVSDAYYWTCFTQLLLPCFLQSFMPRLIKMATRELSVLFGPQKLILVALVCRVFSGFCFLVASFLWLSEWMFSGL